MKDEIWGNNNRLTAETANDLNDTSSSKDVRAVKRFNENRSSENVPILVHVVEKVSSDADKAEVYEKVFFQGGHLRDKCFDESIFNGAVSVVNVALVNLETILNKIKSMTFAMISTGD